MTKLKNLVRKKVNRNGQQSWELCDECGPIEAFGHFCERISSFAFTTRKRYVEVVSHFIDYLYEAKVFGTTTTKKRLNAVLDFYPVLLRDGSDVVIKRLKKEGLANFEHYNLLITAENIQRKPIAPASFSNTLAAINKFLALSEMLAMEAFEIASLKGVKHDNDFSSLIYALNQDVRLSIFEKRKLATNSVLGSVIRFRKDGLTRPGRLTQGRNKLKRERDGRVFPIQMVNALVDASLNWRDRLLWLLLAGCGIRISEALNLRWNDIDIKNKKIYVEDPLGRRFGGESTPEESLRFKGRSTSATYFIAGLREKFFVCLEHYLREEYIPPKNENDASYVFQYLDSKRKGMPYYKVSAAALLKNLKATCKRADINPSQNFPHNHWVVHSLRHAYGDHMLNDFPVNQKLGIYGLQLSEVQMLMGHARIETTKLYARKSRQRLEEKLKLGDTELLDVVESSFLSKPVTK